MSAWRSLLLAPRGPRRVLLGPGRTLGLGQRCRQLHVALVAPGLGDALANLPGARNDGKGHITVPVPDPKLEVLAALERTSPVFAKVEVEEADRSVGEELSSIVGAALSGDADPPELSGKLLAVLRGADAVALAVPCGPDEAAPDPVKWLVAAEGALVSADLDALEQQVCKGGSGGADAELDLSKLRKALAGSKDKEVQRSADALVKDVVAPGLASLRDQLRAGVPAREARGGLVNPTRSQKFEALHPRFEELARGWLNVVVSWRPLLLIADVPEPDAGDAADAAMPGPAGNAASRQLVAHAESCGIPCITACLALEGESAALQDEPEFLNEYLQSFGLRQVGDTSEGSKVLRPWRSQSAEVVSYIPKLLNLLTYYTAGEKEARAWMCQRIGKDKAALPYALASSVGAESQAPLAKARKGASLASDEGVPANLASRAIHTSFEGRVKHVMVWKYEDLQAIGTSESGPSAKDQAKSAGKVKKAKAQDPLDEGDVVEFVLS